MSAIVNSSHSNNFTLSMRASVGHQLASAANNPAAIEARELRNKYNTLTLAEAKKLNGHLNGRRPIRTASVLHKPRAPQPRSLSRTPSKSINQTLALENRTLQDSNRTLNESFYSASSDCKCKSASKASLTSSTSRALKDQFSHFKKFFRISPIRRSFIGSSATSGSSNNISSGRNTGDDHQHHHRKPLPPQPPRLAADLQHNNHQSAATTTASTATMCDQNSLSDYISDLCLNRSQSPPVCPPPPGELKSMIYMESNLDDYSNYDEFTYLRNQRTSALLMNSLHHQRAPEPRSNKNQHQHHRHYHHHHRVGQHSNGSGGSSSNGTENNSPSSLDQDDQDCWQMTSLPVAYERNLTNVMEERQQEASNAAPPGYTENNNSNHSSSDLKVLPACNGFIKPPESFVDTNGGGGVQQLSSGMSHTSSNQSLTSVTTTDSVLDFHRQTGTSFRFSYGQPTAYENGQQRNDAAGLPPRMPTYEPIKTTPTTTSSSTAAAGAIDYGNGGGCLDNDNDATLLSDASTLHGGDSCKCAELERTIGSLKDKLIGKEKELTELQLKQWSSDYLIDQLKSTISRLEKENAQLKKNVMINVNNRVNL